MHIQNLTFCSKRVATPFILKDLVKNGRVKLSRDFYGNEITIPPENGNEISVDHLIPVAQGGTNAISNLVLAIRSMNTRRNKKPLKEVINIHAAKEYLEEVAQIINPQFDGRQYAEQINKTLLGMDIYIDAAGVKKRRIDRPVKSYQNRCRKF